MFLNCHTLFSLRFGAMRVEELLHEAEKNGVNRFVLSDINNTSAILDAHRFTMHEKKFAVQPVAGIDFRNGAQQKFIGIAKKHDGFFELNRFLSKCLHEGEKNLTGKEIKIPDRAPEFKDAFVVYPFSAVQAASANIELRPNEFIGIKPSEVNRLKFSALKDQTKKLVVLSPVTFRNKIDFNAHRLLRAMDNNTILSKLPPSEQAAPDEIMVSEQVLNEIYKDVPDILHNTNELLGKCVPIDFEFGESKNKKTFTGSIVGDREELMKLCNEGMLRRYPHAGDKIGERFKKEINIITEKGFTSYFLINHDIVQFAQRNNLFYVGRGSGANSMVAYLLYITDVDPIELDLYFERFINPSRKNPPDFDIDFSSDERDQVIHHIFETHGYSHTALLATYSEMKDDSLTRELGKVFGLPKEEIDALQDYRHQLQSPDHITRLIHQYTQILRSFPNHLSIHAGGILISAKPIEYYTALCNPPKGFPLSQFSMVEAEDVGFAKFDILSQRGLGKVRDAVDLVKLNKNETIDIRDVKRFTADEKVRENLKQAKLMGAFYVESPAMRMLLTKLRASTYLDLVAASSIIRPGVAQSGMMQEYIRRFHMDDHGKQIAIPELWNIMEETFGVMVYQEDVIKVAYLFGDFTLEEADKLRRGMGGKYRGRQEFLDVKEKFFSNCRKKGRDEKLIREVWFQMETFGGYAFAKGHSASYAIESYQCMFLKTHFPLEYLVAVINNGGGFFACEFYIHEARMCGGTIHAPHLNKSDVPTMIDGCNIYLGFHLVGELEKNIPQQMVEERKRNGEFSSLENFMRRVSISAEQLRLLIRIGAFRFTGRTTQQLLWDIHSILGHEKKSVARRELFQVEKKKFIMPELFTDVFDTSRNEIELLGFPLCLPFNLIEIPKHLTEKSRRLWMASDLKNLNGRIIEIIGYYVTCKPTSTKKGEAMMFGCFIDKDGHFFDTNHFPEATKKFPFRGKGCYLIKGKVAEEFGFYSINVLEMQKIDYIMNEEDAETKARSKPDPSVTPVIVPAAKKYDYLLVISPPPHINNDVVLLKKKFQQQFNFYSAMKSKPHITLCHFSEYEAKEEEIIKQIAAVTSRYAPFHIRLQNFDGFQSHTIYIDIVNDGFMLNAVSELKKKIKQITKNAEFISKFHLSIARQLDPERYSRAVAEFCEQVYHASFISKAITLLRKETHRKTGFEIRKEFILEGKATSPVNGAHRVFNPFYREEAES